MNPKMAFSFGKNWQRYLKFLDKDRIRIAELSLKDFLGIDNIESKRFLDVGCGSGLFSYSAFDLGASSIVSIDNDPFALECCKHLNEKAGTPNNWKILNGSVLDRNFLSQLGLFDVVYAWGVLHHTGKMWEAIMNVAHVVDINGYYYIAIYNKVDGILGSKFWFWVKKLYNILPKAGKISADYLYMATYITKEVVRLKNPIPHIAGYKKNRGMAWKTDVSDWLGGYPYEFATEKEIIEFMQNRCPNFALVKAQSTNGLGNNLFLFRRLS